MADENVLRPQRRPMPQSPSQQRTPEENIAMLEQMKQMRESMSQEEPAQRAKPLSSSNPLNRVLGDMPPEVQQQLQQAKVQQMAAQNPEDTWIPEAESEPIQSHRPAAPQSSSWLTDTSDLQRPPRANQPPVQQNVPSPMVRRPGGPKNRGKPVSVKINSSPALDAVLAKVQEKTGIYEPIELPSKGIFYNGEDGPRNGILHIRRMTGEEEQVLATQRIVKKGDAINIIFRKCMQEQYDPAWLLTADRTYMLIYLRGISYTPKYDVEINCPACRSRFSHALNLDEMYVNDCPIDFTPDSLHGVLPTTELEYSYRLSRGYDEQKLQEYRQRLQQTPSDDDTTDDTLNYRTAQLLENIDAITDKQELLFLVSKLPSSDSNHLMNTVNEPPFGADTSVDIECPLCGHNFPVDMPMEAGFFFPRARKGSRTQATS